MGKNAYYEGVIAAALEAGRAAAAEKEAAMRAAGPKWAVTDADLAGNPIPGAPVYTMLGLCGFAWLVLPDGRCPEARYVKTLPGCYKRYEGRGYEWRPREVYGGQMMEVKEAAMAAMAKVLNDEGWFGGKCYVDSRLD